MEKLEPNFNPDRGRVGFLEKLGEKINRRGKKGETCSFRSFQQRVTIFDGQTSSTTTSPFIPRVSPGYGGERMEEGRKEWRRVGGCIKARYEANHGADGNKYFIASKTYHLPIERMNYSV